MLKFAGLVAAASLAGGLTGAAVASESSTTAAVLPAQPAAVVDPTLTPSRTVCPAPPGKPYYVDSNGTSGVWTLVCWGR
jgi:hypothetical protein